MRTIEHWKKIINHRLIEISVKNDDIWYLAYAGDKLLTRADASLESLRDTLYGNGCIRLIKNNSWEKKNVEISASWKKIDWFQLPCVYEKEMNRTLLADIINDSKNILFFNAFSISNFKTFFIPVSLLSANSIVHNLPTHHLHHMALEHTNYPLDID